MSVEKDDELTPEQLKKQEQLNILQQVLGKDFGLYRQPNETRDNIDLIMSG